MKLKHSIYYIRAFTLIEILVAITILSIIMISVFSIYITSVNISAKSDANRMLQENIKNVFSQISEDIRVNGLEWISKQIGNNCTLDGDNRNFLVWNKLCTYSDNTYFLGKKEILSNSYIRTDNTYCSDIKNQCFILKNGVPLTNNLISVEKLDFIASNLDSKGSKKVTMNVVLRPAKWKGVKNEYLETTRIQLQATTWERFFK